MKKEFDPQKKLYTLCVLVEDIADGQSGGTTAAPIAGSIFRYLKAHPELAKGAAKPLRGE